MSNFQDAAKRFFKTQLGLTSGAYADIASKYYKAALEGTLPSPGGDVSAADITDSTAVGRAVLTAADAAAARAAIGAGTSNVVVGTAATNAKAGNYTPDIAGVTGLQAALDLKATVAALALLDARVAALETP